ncbi:hypothetical protein [Trichormus sp. NMC-1]|uniref:hypothetical protein n=1 Tax=Trichormus sp. NMC-1 TaxID=1853259 RepID=UPI0008DBF4D2|nr:hypothetical protein [Trichormus sp. NMC-1]
MFIKEQVSIVPFTVDTFNSLFNSQINDANIEATVDLAASNPLKLYYFMQRYAYFNSFAGSLVARLASAIGLSYDLFRYPEEPVLDQSDRGLEIAAKVFAATIDEHADGKAYKVPHRTLAQTTLKAISDYAKLSNVECNQIAQTPSYMQRIVADFIFGYQGKIGDVEALVTAIGYHIGSELLADREYSLIDKVIRYNHRGVAFDTWLQGKKIDVGSKRINPWYWIVVHGKHNDLGVEAEHRDLALEALNLVAQYRPESNEEILKWASKGFLDFVALQSRLFSEIETELRTIKTFQIVPNLSEFNIAVTSQ